MKRLWNFQSLFYLGYARIFVKGFLDDWGRGNDGQVFFGFFFPMAEVVNRQEGEAEEGGEIDPDGIHGPKLGEGGAADQPAEGVQAQASATPMKVMTIPHAGCLCRCWRSGGGQGLFRRG